MNAYEKYIASDPKQCCVCQTPFSEVLPAITKEFTGELYAFCSEACIEAFEADPEKYEQFEDENGEDEGT
ncbi:MAG: YHS domain-containing protein [bacterium]|nr:YHS domain-containing protein [bacterium]